MAPAPKPAQSQTGTEAPRSFAWCSPAAPPPCSSPGLGHHIFKQLAEQLLDFFLRLRQRFLSRGSRSIYMPTAAANPDNLAVKQPLALQAVQQRIHRARTEPVSVTPKLFDHLQSKNRLLAGVIQDVEPNKPGIEVAVFGVGCVVLHRNKQAIQAYVVDSGIR